ncbi:LOW QUALITY PROTEIN: hypothetical protein TorRG33x02_108210 [Trema orientale]|uniref:Uncharacterized protein n=1 Tax=Trema orientale TaxID=63057 RepID=A0A2P5F625_TREOI|nr:LOW QUALITY PROTEIN: hypothetical protein TorRG33x02_108210 [Trema orientale]
MMNGRKFKEGPAIYKYGWKFFFFLTLEIVVLVALIILTTQ